MAFSWISTIPLRRRSHPALIGCWALALWAVAAAMSAAGPPVEELEHRLTTAAGKERLQLLGELAEAIGDSDRSKEQAYAEEALALAEQLGDVSAQVLAHRHVGAALAWLGKPEKAIPHFERSLALARNAGDRKAQGDALSGLGIAFYHLGRFSEARQRFEEALALRTEINDEKGIAAVHANLGATLCYQGGDAGRQHFEQSLEMYRRIGDPKGLTMALTNVGIVRQHTGDYAGAVDLYLEALAIAEREGNRPGLALVCGNLSVIYKNLKQPDKGLLYAERALALHREIGDEQSMATDLASVGSLYADKQDLNKAAAYYEQSLKIGAAVGAPQLLMEPLIDLGDTRLKQGRFSEARDLFERALRETERGGIKGGTASALEGLARAQKSLGDLKGCRSSLQRALQIAQEINDREITRDVHEDLAKLYATLGQYARAYDHHVRYSEAQNAIVHEQATTRIAEMQAKYESEKKQREIEVLRRDNEIQILRLKAARLRSYALVAGLFVVAAGLLLLFRRYLHLVAFWRSRSYVGHYRLLSQIGSGGMGVVYKAAHVRDRTRPVAVKVLREEYTHDPVLRQRLKNEAVLIDQLDHPHIVKVYERGEYDQRLFIAMEWLEGRSLAEVIRHGERLAVKECLAIVRQLGEALAKIHSRGIVHRDVKPENVMLIQRDGDPHFVKLLDFDVAKSGSLTQLTQTGIILGTLAYLAPEQITRQASSTASDVYSLGVVAYETLTGEQPFFASAPVDVIRQILANEPVPPAYLRPEVPPDLDALILELLSKEPQARPSDEALLGRLAAIEERME